MPKQIIYHACTICSKEYKTNEEAVTCEGRAAPQQGNQYHMGDFVDFQNEKIGNPESKVHTEHYIYEMQKGKILGRSITIDPRNQDHVYTLMVGCDDYPEMELGLVWISEGVNRTGWFSPAEMKYPAGMHTSMQDHV